MNRLSPTAAVLFGSLVLISVGCGKEDGASQRHSDQGNAPGQTAKAKPVVGQGISTREANTSPLKTSTEIPGVSGDWVVDWEKMRDSYMKQGLNEFLAGMNAASNWNWRITISGNTIRMRDTEGGGWNDCTATFKTLLFGSEEQLLDAIVDYHKLTNESIFRKETIEMISSGKLNPVITEITESKNNNPGEGNNILKVGQKCTFCAPGPKGNNDEIVFIINLLGDTKSFIFAKSDSSRGKQMIRDSNSRRSRKPVKTGTIRNNSGTQYRIIDSQRKIAITEY